jgi:nitrilase
MRDSVRVAVVQASPVALNCDATTEKACRLIAEAGERGAELVVLPEVLIPGYPRGISFGALIGSRTDAGRRAFARYWENSVELPGPVTEALGAAAARAHLYAVVGVSERVAGTRGGTLYNTVLYIGPDGRLLGKHRKLKPTSSERLIWGEGDGSTLTTVSTPFGIVGGLICWENYMPLARMAMYAKGVEIYVAPTADNRDSWQATIQHIALEGRCFVLACNQFMVRSDIPADWEDIGPGPEVIGRGGSAIVGPMGEYVAGPLFGEEGILVADLALDKIAEARFDMDVVGHYNRPDVFSLSVDERDLSVGRLD